MAKWKVLRTGETIEGEIVKDYGDDWIDIELTQDTRRVPAANLAGTRYGIRGIKIEAGCIVRHRKSLLRQI